MLRPPNHTGEWAADGKFGWIEAIGWTVFLALIKVADIVIRMRRNRR